ncbi:catechol O-methyltransferase A-like [Lytechinus pictus]|uniref:catechol O-methyltransferase A-like n=1 Tax=Lytechinus pictus TaxID=7653 RepID=UPI0030B9C17F
MSKVMDGSRSFAKDIKPCRRKATARAEDKKRKELQVGWFHAIRVTVFDSLYLPSGIVSSLYDRWYGPLPDRLYQYITEHAQRGNPDSAMSAFDRFNNERQWTWCLGPAKAKIIGHIIKERQPLACLELGTFVGYSAINAARNLPKGARYICVEPNEQYAKVCRKIVEFTGLDDTIHIMEGYSHDVIKQLGAQPQKAEFDFFFFDHQKSVYKSDLLLMEKENLIRPGNVVIADNVITSGAPDYLEYVRSSPKYRSEFIESPLQNTALMDGLEISVMV